MIDRTTKVLLLAIALGLWTQIATDWARPTPVLAQSLGSDGQLQRIVSSLQFISADTSSMSSSLKSIDLANMLRRK